MFRTVLFLEIIGRNTANMSLITRILVFLFWYLLQLICVVLDLLFFGEVISLLLKWVEKESSRFPIDVLPLGMHNSTIQQIVEKVHVKDQSSFAQWSCRITKRKSLGLGIIRWTLYSRKVDRVSDQEWMRHEFAHTLQWYYRGLIYIPEALFAQRFGGYTLPQPLNTIRRLKNINPEQQAVLFSKFEKLSKELQSDILAGKW